MRWLAINNSHFDDGIIKVGWHQPMWAMSKPSDIFCLKKTAMQHGVGSIVISVNGVFWSIFSQDSAWGASKPNVFIAWETWKSGLQMSETWELAWDLTMRKTMEDGETWDFAWGMLQKVIRMKQSRMKQRGKPMIEAWESAWDFWETMQLLASAAISNPPF